MPLPTLNGVTMLPLALNTCSMEWQYTGCPGNLNVPK